MQKEFVTLDLSSIIPYENNPRINEDAVPDVEESMRQCGNIDPIEVDENNVILSGHTRLMALQQLGETETVVLRVTGLSEDQKKKYRILANKTGEKALWDFERLSEELEGLDFGGYEFGFDFDSAENVEDTKYTEKTDIPQYEPTSEKWEVTDLYDDEKCRWLQEEIGGVDNIPSDIQKFLQIAAYRHVVFNYKRIADFYANTSADIQRLMERSALVIIDYDDAIKNGYVDLFSAVEGLKDDEE